MQKRPCKCLLSYFCHVKTLNVCLYMCMSVYIYIKHIYILNIWLYSCNGAGRRWPGFVRLSSRRGRWRWVHPYSAHYHLNTDEGCDTDCVHQIMWHIHRREDLSSPPSVMSYPKPRSGGDRSGRHIQSHFWHKHVLYLVQPTFSSSSRSSVRFPRRSPRFKMVRLCDKDRCVDEMQITDWPLTLFLSWSGWI